jgi:hypothetical protein
VKLLWIYDIPNWASLLIIAAAILAVGWTGLFGLRAWVSRLHSQHNHNEIVSYFWGAVVLFYGVMLGLIAVGVWEQFSGTDEKVALEASALAELYRDVSAYPEPDRGRLQADLRTYTLNVIHTSWPLQRSGIVPSQTNEILWTFQRDLAAFQPRSFGEIVLHDEALRTYNRLVELRRMRLHIVLEGGLRSVVWVVVALGAVVTLSVSWFYQTVSFPVHFWMVTLTAVLLGLIIWLVAMMDHPFRGEVSIPPEPFQHVYDSLMTRSH